MRLVMGGMMAFGLLACSSSSSSDDPVAMMSQATKEICACADKACTKAVMEKYRAQSEKIKAKKDSLTDDQKAALKQHTSKLMGCMMKHAVAGMKMPTPKK
jgi:hypothetical protein